MAATINEIVICDTLAQKFNKCSPNILLSFVDIERKSAVADISMAIGTK